MDTTYIETIHYILSVFDKITTHNIINHIYNTYGEIEKNNPDQNNMKMINPYNTEHTLAILIQQLEAGKCFKQSVKQVITNKMIPKA